MSRDIKMELKIMNNTTQTKKVKICPYGFHVNDEHSECDCGNKQTIEERVLSAIIFNELTDYDESREPTRWKINQEKVLNLLKSEQSRLLTRILDKKKRLCISEEYGMNDKHDETVFVEDILTIAQAEGVEL